MDCRTHPPVQRFVRPGEPSSRSAETVRSIGAHALAPLRNRILAALPPEDYWRLLPMLERVPLPRGGTVYDAGRPRTHLYFIAQGAVSRIGVTKDGKSAEFDTTGNEGVVGVSLCLGGVSTSSQTVVVVEGLALRLRADLLMRELDKHGPLLGLILRYFLSVMEEAGQIAACNRLHPLRKRLSRWLLSLVDRVGDSRLPLTHEVIAGLLGVRREGVTLEFMKLQEKGLISYRRGQISVLDRRGLEARACECLTKVRRARDYLTTGSPMHLPAQDSPRRMAQIDQAHQHASILQYRERARLDLPTDAVQRHVDHAGRFLEPLVAVVDRRVRADGH